LDLFIETKFNFVKANKTSLLLSNFISQLFRKAESNYNSKVSIRTSKLNIVKSIEVKLAQARAVVKSVKIELQFAKLALTKLKNRQH